MASYVLPPSLGVGDWDCVLVWTIAAGVFTFACWILGWLFPAAILFLSPSPVSSTWRSSSADCERCPEVMKLHWAILFPDSNIQTWFEIISQHLSILLFPPPNNFKPISSWGNKNTFVEVLECIETKHFTYLQWDDVCPPSQIEHR